MVLVDFDGGGDFYLCEMCERRYDTYGGARGCEESCSKYLSKFLGGY